MADFEQTESAPSRPVTAPAPAVDKRNIPLSQAEKNVFGADAKRGEDGKPIERGVGSPQQHVGRQSLAAARDVSTLAESIAASAKAVADEATKLAAAAKEAVQHAGKSLAKHEADDEKLAEE